MKTALENDEKEVIVKLNGWVVYKGLLVIYHTRINRRQLATNIRWQGTWIQHDHYNGGIIWASWEPKTIDNKCISCNEMIEDLDLTKLLCFAKAIK